MGGNPKLGITTNNHQQPPPKNNNQQLPNTTNNNHRRPPTKIKNKQLPTTTHHHPQEQSKRPELPTTSGDLSRFTPISSETLGPAA